MPIEVRHGEPDMAALVALATVLGAGQQRVPEIPRIQIGGVPSGGGGGRGGTRHERVPWHRRAWGGPVTRVGKEEQLRKELQVRTEAAAERAEALMPYEAEKMELQKELEFQGWKREYTQKQRMEITRLNDTDDMVMNTPEFADVRKQWREQYIQRMAGITSKLRPPRPGEVDYPDVPHPETGEPQPAGIGRSWVDQYGNVKTRKPTGEEITQVPYPKTPRGMEDEHRRTMELKMAEQEAEDRKEKAKVRRNLLLEKDPVSGERAYDPIQVEGIMRELFPSAEVGLPGTPAGQMGATDVELEEELRRRIDAQTPWWEGAERQGTKVTEDEKRMPPEVGQAVLFVRLAREKYKTIDKIPSGILAKIQRAKSIINQYPLSERIPKAGRMTLAVREANARLQEAEDRYGTLDKIPPELIPALKRDLELVQRHTQGEGR